MRLVLNNIGKLSKADIELNGITVIAGENNAGKSTVGKALYSIFNSFYDVENRLEVLRKETIRAAVSNFFFTFDLFSFYYEGLISEIISLKKSDMYTEESIREKISSFLRDNGIDEKGLFDGVSSEEVEKSLRETSNRIYDILKISKDNLFKNLLDRSFEAEFRGQICNFFSGNEATVYLTIKNETVTVNFLKNRVKSFEKRINLLTEAVYIDDPYVLDNNFERYAYYRRRSYTSPHRSSLALKLRHGNSRENPFEELVVNNKLEKIFNKINNVCEGELKEDANSLSYSTPGVSEGIELNNLSTGLKTFVILKSLLQNGAIGDKSTIILDEPEIHLHPAWQILFAEIIVLLQKEFDMTILINTHSPYFLEAIQVYTEKYHIDENCKYYLAENTGDVSVIHDVTDSPDRIYKKLAEPFQMLENDRFSDD